MNNTQKQLLDIVTRNLKKEKYGYVDIKTSRAILNRNNAYLIDVRPEEKVVGITADEYPLENLHYVSYRKINNLFKMDHIHKDSSIILSCSRGLFSSRVAGYLEMLGYSNVFILNADIGELLSSNEL